MTPQSIQDVRPRKLLLGSGRHVAGIDAKIGDLRLRGREWKANVTDAVTAATLERTIEGASTVGIDVNDEHGRLRNHKLLESRFDVELSEMFFRFVAASRQGSTLSLTFEDRDVARLRQMKGPKKAFRDKVTRAEFVLMLLQEVQHPPIKAFIPELHIEQPIEKAKGVGHRDVSLSEGQATKGLDKHAKLTVKGVKATASQIKSGERALAVAASLDAPFDAAAALICALSVESVMGAATHNWLEIIPQTAAGSGINPTDLEESCTGFLKGYGAGSKGAIAWVNGGEHDVAGVCQDVQNSGAGLSSHGHANYGPWVDEAKKWVEAYKGGIGGGTLTTTTTVAKRYAFERKKNEDSWTCIQRLASEVKWRAFFSNGIFYYVAEPDLLSAKIEMRVSDDAPGIDDISWDWDMGKKVAEVRITGRAKAWAAGPGTVADVNDQGPANGRYIVSDIQSDLFDDNVTVTLKRPTKPLPEPAPETSQKTTTKHFPSDGRYFFPFDHYVWGRVDMGVDFTGSGDIVAIGDAQVVATNSPGWPNGGAGPAGQGIVYKLLGGSHSGKYVYVFEGITVHASKGKVSAGDKIGSFYPGSSIEIGWYCPDKGNACASDHYSEGQVTSEGSDMRAFLKGLEH